MAAPGVAAPDGAAPRPAPNAPEGGARHRSAETPDEQDPPTPEEQDDHPTEAPDRSERAERVRRAGGRTEAGTAAGRIDETLTRLTAAHAGLPVASREGDDVDAIAVRARRRRLPIVGKVLVAALAVLVMAATTVGWATKSWLGSAVRDAGAVDLASSAIVDAEAQSGDENVLIVTGDAAGSASDASPRTETITVAHIPAGGGPAVLVALPSELQIDRPSCDRWDATTSAYLDAVPGETGTRLVSALDIGGPRCITRAVQQLSGLAITMYVGMDASGVSAVADALGGIEICTPSPVLDDVLGPVVPDAGTSVLDGLHAADFLLAGNVEGDPPSDRGRIVRQQEMLAAALEGSLGGTTLLDVPRLAALQPALGDALVADGGGIDEMLALARSLRQRDGPGVTFAAVPTAGGRNAQGNLVLRDVDAAALFAAVRQDSALPDPGVAAGPAPADMTVELLNASDRVGLAAQVGDTLHSLGFGVGAVGSAALPGQQTVVRFSPDQAAAAAVLAATVPSATPVPDPGATGVLQLVLGRSFDGVVRAPAEPATEPAQRATAVAECP